jgi:xylulokinase
MINAGTAVQVIELQDKPRPFDREGANRYLFELGVAGQTFAIGALNSAGHSLNWWRSLVDANMSHDEFEALAAEEPSAEDGPLYLPWLQGTGTPYLLDGPYGAFVQLSSTAERSILTRAVMDGVALGIRLCAEALIEPGRLADKQVLITGGVPKSRLMREILSNVLPASVAFRSFSDMSALGAVTHAAVAAGLAPSAGNFLADFDYGEVTLVAEPALQARYERLYAVFKRWADQVASG